MSDYMRDKGLLIMFLCNHCPYVQAIAERLVDVTNLLKKNGINTLAVMSNDHRMIPADSPPNMKKFAVNYGWDFPYLVDEEQSVGKSYNAVCTPDFFGFNEDGDLQYRGRLDDAQMGDPSGRSKELVEAMLQIGKTGQGPHQQTASIGCSIKWR